jgi:hypothetical protein
MDYFGLSALSSLRDFPLETLQPLFITEFQVMGFIDVGKEGRPCKRCAVVESCRFFEI